MLKHFQVPEDIAVRVRPDRLRTTVEEVFRKMGVSDEDAALAADVLMYADLRGIDTHGVSNMLRAYVRGYSEGWINPRPAWKVIRQTPGAAIIDGDGGLGIIIAPRAMEVAIEKAAKTGSCSIAIKNSGHLGAAGYHAHMAARRDMLGMCMTGGGNAMLPTFGAEPRLGTNPIAFAAPAATQPTFVFDAAMTSIAGNKIGLAQRMGRRMEPGWLGLPDGTPDMKGGQAASFAAGSIRRQLPLGSTRDLGSHKGYSLGVMVDILCGALSGAPGFDCAEGKRRAHFVAAWDIAAFVPVDQFKRTMDGMLRTLRETKPMPGEERVYYAGLPEDETEAERTARGIPLHPEVIDWFRGICGELEIPFTLA